MNKIKKILVSAFCILSVFMTILSIGVCAANTNPSFTYMWTEGLDKFDDWRGGKFLKLGFVRGWSFVTYVDQENKDAYKYTSCTAYKYENREYSNYGSTQRKRGTNQVITTGSLTINGYVEKVEAYGEIFHNSSSASGIMEKGKLVVYRKGAVIEDRYKKYKVY